MFREIILSASGILRMLLFASYSPFLRGSLCNDILITYLCRNLFVLVDSQPPNRKNVLLLWTESHLIGSVGIFNIYEGRGADRRIFWGWINVHWRLAKCKLSLILSGAASRKCNGE